MCGWVGGAEFSLNCANLILNLNANPNYKYMFGPHMGHALICEKSQRNTYNQNTAVNQSRREPLFSLRTRLAAVFSDYFFLITLFHNPVK